MHRNLTADSEESKYWNKLGRSRKYMRDRRIWKQPRQSGSVVARRDGNWAFCRGLCSTECLTWGPSLPSPIILVTGW